MIQYKHVAKISYLYEFPDFVKQVKKILKPDEFIEIREYIANNPENGDVVPGTGGLRKMRWAAGGKGKRGGARIIYYYHASSAEILLLAAYIKKEQVDLTTQDKRFLKKLIIEYLK